jgi:multidrug efflux system outer membrane protein
VTHASVLPVQWWKSFQDEDLDALEIQAVQANQDLKRAVARVSEARALLRASKAEFYPSVVANAAYSRNRLSANRADTPRQNPDFNDYVASFDLSYELDVWGRVRRTVEVAKAEAASVTTDLEVVLLTLSADVARNYESIRAIDNEIRVVQDTIGLRRDAVHLQQSRRQAGLVNEMDLSRAQTELANVQAEVEALNRSRAEVEHALAILCGQPPAHFSVAVKQLNVVPPAVPVGLPSELLERRPDIIEAEYSLQAANAQIGVAKAAFFPTIKLTGGAGFASADLSTVVNWPSRLAAFGPSISVPVFQGGRNRANLDAAKAVYEENVATYRASVLNAFREVEDALSDLKTLASQSQAVDRALVSARDTAHLAGERYRQGLTSYLDVVDAERDVLQAERQQTELNGQRALSTILLAKALGGGWQTKAAIP